MNKDQFYELEWKYIYARPLWYFSGDNKSFFLSFVRVLLIESSNCGCHRVKKDGSLPRVL